MGEPDILTARLRLRPLRSEDLDVLAALNADERVMAPFGGALPRDKTAPWLERLLGHWRAHDGSR